MDPGNPLQPFIDQMGIAFDELGAPRMMGRIFGYLLVCDPPWQSAPQLCEALDASKGSVNTITRQLIQAGLLERVAVKGERATYLQVRSGAWSEMIRFRMRGMHHLRMVAEGGLELLANAPAEQRERLQRFHDFYEYIEREFEAFISRFEEEEG